MTTPYPLFEDEGAVIFGLWGLCGSQLEINASVIVTVSRLLVMGTWGGGSKFIFATFACDVPVWVFVVLSMRW